tara:strand:+ start:10808 stop:11893 length:1086 start_codon:yes stop_codon:yes gene_type:complete
MSKFKDFAQLTQRGKFRRIKAKYNAWKTKWDAGEEWGIVGGTGEKTLPDTVLEEVLEHGEATYARDSARTIEGLGALLESMMEILDGDVILSEHKKQLIEDITQMEGVIKNPKWNPRNIPFHTVIGFTEGNKGEKPTIERGKMHGHYRTMEYNQYVEWAMDNKPDFKGRLAPTKEIWSNKKEGKAEPPLWQAITGEKETGIIAIARLAAEAVEGVTIGDDSTIILHGNASNMAKIAQIASVREKVNQVLQNTNIYPAGKSRAPVKDRLNAAFTEQVYAIAPDEIDSLSFVRGWNDVVGVENITQIRFQFPKSNISLNQVIRAVLGDEKDTYETPKSRSGDAKPGLVLKQKAKNWVEILEVR